MTTLGEHFEDYKQIRMFEPRTGERTKCRFVFGQLADNLGLGAGVREDVEEVVDDDREIGIIDTLNIINELSTRLGTHQLIERITVVLATRTHLSLQKLLLVLILAALLVVVEPEFGHQFVDRQRHQARKYRISSILRCRRQDGAIEIIDRNIEKRMQHRVDRTPLIITEIVDQEQRRLRVVVDYGEDVAAHQRVRHHGRLLVATIDPRSVVATHKLAKFVVCLALLVRKHLFDTLVRRVGKLDLPANDLLVDGTPLLERASRAHLRRNATKLSAIIGRSLLSHKLLLMDILLDRQQHLIGVDGFDQIVGDLRSDGLVHNILLLALGDHNHRRGWANLLDAGQGFESGNAGHHLVENDQVVTLGRSHIDCVISIIAGIDLITFGFEEENVRLQQFDLVINP